MVTLNTGEGDLLCLVESLESEVVILVEIGVLKSQEVHVIVIGLEPLTLLRIHDSVLVEHHQEESVQCLESCFLRSLNSGISS